MRTGKRSIAYMILSSGFLLTFLAGCDLEYEGEHQMVDFSPSGEYIAFISNLCEDSEECEEGEKCKKTTQFNMLTVQTILAQSRRNK